MNKSQTSFINLPQLSRDEKLQIWLRRNGKTYMELAFVAGVKKAAFSLRLSEGNLTSEQHRRLVEYGVPAEILPPAIDKKPGPKPKFNPDLTV